MSQTMSNSEQQTILDMSRDMSFVGIFGIIMGALYCLSLFGAILGIPYIIVSLRLRDAAEYFKRYAGNGEGANLHQALEKQKSVFYITKILIIIGLVLSAVGIGIAMLIISGTMMEQMRQY